MDMSEVVNSLDQLLDDFARLRRENLAALQTLNLQHEDWTRPGNHPSLVVCVRQNADYRGHAVHA
jgi:hypothetical protein